MPVRWVRDVYYFQVDDSVIAMIGLSPADPVSRRLRGKWVPSTSRFGARALDHLKPLLDYDSFMRTITGGFAAAPWTSHGSGVLNGVPVLEFEAAGGYLNVADVRPHYMIRILLPPSTPGTIHFTGWNQPVEVIAPSPAEIFAEA